MKDSEQNHICPSGYYWSQGHCYECSEGFYCSGTDEGIKCPRGYYCPTGTGSPIICPAGYVCPNVNMPEPKMCSSFRVCFQRGQTSKDPMNVYEFPFRILDITRRFLFFSVSYNITVSWIVASFVGVLVLYYIGLLTCLYDCTMWFGIIVDLKEALFYVIINTLIFVAQEVVRLTILKFLEKLFPILYIYVNERIKKGKFFGKLKPPNRDEQLLKGAISNDIHTVRRAVRKGGVIRREFKATSIKCEVGKYFSLWFGGWNAFHFAAYHGNNKMIDEILRSEKNREKMNFTTTSLKLGESIIVHPKNALDVAISSGKYHTFRHLLRKGMVSSTRSYNRMSDDHYLGILEEMEKNLTDPSEWPRFGTNFYNPVTFLYWRSTKKDSPFSTGHMAVYGQVSCSNPANHEFSQFAYMSFWPKDYTEISKNPIGTMDATEMTYELDISDDPGEGRIPDEKIVLHCLEIKKVREYIADVKADLRNDDVKYSLMCSSSFGDLFQQVLGVFNFVDDGENKRKENCSTITLKCVVKGGSGLVFDKLASEILPNQEDAKVGVLKVMTEILTSQMPTRYIAGEDQKLGHNVLLDTILGYADQKLGHNVLLDTILDALNPVIKKTATHLQNCVLTPDRVAKLLKNIQLQEMFLMEYVLNGEDERMNKFPLAVKYVKSWKSMRMFPVCSSSSSSVVI